MLALNPRLGRHMCRSESQASPFANEREPVHFDGRSQERDGLAGRCCTPVIAGVVMHAQGSGTLGTRVRVLLLFRASVLA